MNTTASSLVLSNGAVSNSLLKAGGQGLQDVCTAHVQQHGNVKEWSFATTGPGNLKCKHVIHTVGANHNGPGGSAEKVIKYDNIYTYVHMYIVLKQIEQLENTYFSTHF